MLQKCKLCQKEFYVRPSETINRQRHCCSKICFYKFIAIWKICEQCRKKYRVKPYLKYKSKYCSDKCRQNGHQGFIPANKGVHLSEDRKLLLRKPRPSIAGSKHYNYRGGITPLSILFRQTSEYRTWFKQVLKRDQYVCRNCKKYNPGKLVVHHLISFMKLWRKYNFTSLFNARKCKELFDLTNGITLCVPCHKITSNYGWKALKNPIDTNLYL